MSSRHGFWALWLTLLGFKCLLAVRLPLFGDEAWYWLEGQHPAWAYSDLPGLTAWLARAGVDVFGHSEFGVRAPFLALSMAVPLLLRAAAACAFGAAHGDATGRYALLLPLCAGLGILALPDVPLTFAAALCLLASLRLRARVDAAGVAWLGSGLAIGALSHYRFAPLVAAGLLGFLLDAGARRALADRRVWIALAFGAVAWLPLAAWNASHDDAGLAFQLAERHPWTPHAEGFWLPVSQLVVVTPLLLFALLAALRDAWRRWRAGAEGPWGMLFGMAALPLCGYLALAFVADRERVSFHWLLQAWLPLLVLLPPVLARWPRVLRSATELVAGAGVVALLGYLHVAATPALRAELAESRWYPDNFAGWHEIAHELRSLPGVADGRLQPIADNFMLGAQLGFALRRPLPVLDDPLNHKHGRALQLRLWGLQTALDAPHDKPRLLLVEDGARPPRERLDYYHAVCRRAGALGRTHTLDVDHGRKRFLVLLLDGAAARGPDCPLPALAWIDEPARGAAVGAQFTVAGWAFKDGAGIARVVVTLDGSAVAEARLGIARPHVREFWRISTDPAQPRVGFEAQLDARALPRGTYWLGLELHGRDGSVERWPQQRLQIDAVDAAQGRR